jgi:hypothetical protein
MAAVLSVVIATEHVSTRSPSSCRQKSSGAGAEQLLGARRRDRRRSFEQRRLKLPLELRIYLISED